MAPNPESVIALVHERPGVAWLDGVREPGWSVLAWDPVEVVTDGADWPDAGRRLGRPGGGAGLPFASGVLGYLGYGAGHRVETVPAEAPTPEPEVWLARYEGALSFRHADRTWHLAGPPSFRREAERLLEAATELPPPAPPSHPTLRRSVDRALFEDRVRRIRRLIAEGDCYQVNLTRPVHLAGTGSAWEAYRRLRALSSAAYCAWLRLADDLAVLSNSPELFLAVRDGEVRSRPVKGTRPRDPDPTLDAALREELRAAQKDRAELAMIVDLVRNDLGRVAVPGSVTTGPRTLSAHANVHHAWTEVSATLEPGRDAWDALAATFPPGSVTGAPKVRACRRIAELESSPRGVYCGVIGYVADGGDATWSVAIRTAVATADGLRYHVGGGIVADSDPAAEWWETVHKGAALDRAFAADPDTDVAIAEPTPSPRPHGAPPTGG